MTKLLSCDQNVEEGRYCPACNADWRASEIPRESLDKGYYGHVAPCEKKCMWDDDYDEASPCTCPPRYFSDLVGCVSHGDVVSLWACPRCGTRWDRWTGEEVHYVT